MKNDDYKTCPYCGENIKTIAVKCRYCKSMLVDEEIQGFNEEEVFERQTNAIKDSTVSGYQHPSSRKTKAGLIAVLFIAILLLIFGTMFITGLLDINDMYALLGGEKSVEDSETVIQEEPKEDLEEVIQEESKEDSETIIEKQTEESSETTNQDGVIGSIIFVDVPEATFLHLRSDPGSSHSSLDQLNRGTVLHVIGETIDSDGDWWLNVITLDGIGGWVHSDYVTDNPAIIKSDDISDERQEELKAIKDKDFYNDFVLNHLGWSKYKILDSYGLPDSIDWAGGAGGVVFMYEDMGVAFVFGGAEGIVNNFLLFPGASLLGINIGKMNFDDIEIILGSPNYRGAIEEGADYYVLVYYLGAINESQGEIEIYFFSDGDDIPPDYVNVNWKKYWW